MDIFSQLDTLLEAQPLAEHSSSPNPASVLVQLGTPSTSIAILDNGTIHSHCISSLSDDESTLFQACSISKPITALAVFRLIDQGRLSLHTSISEYLAPADVEILETAETAGLAKYITVSSLLSHTSGLETSGVYGFPGYSSSSSTTYDSGVDNLPDIRTVISGKPPVNTLRIMLKDWPGHRFRYSGGGTTVLQLILERVTGLPFALIIQQHVFDPLDMRRSGYTPPSIAETNGMNNLKQQGKGNYSRAYYTGYCPCEDPQRNNPEQAAAGLWSTPEDLLKAGRAIQMSLEGAPGAILSVASARAMLTEVQDGVAHSWFVTKEPFSAVRHAGSNMPGWRCNIVCYTDLDFEKDECPDHSANKTSTSNMLKKCGIAVMTNSAQGVTAYSKIMSAICYLKNWPLPPGTWADTDVVIPFADMHAGVDPRWNEWRGKWESGWELLEKDGWPHMSFKGMPMVRMHVAAGPQETVESLDLVCVGLEIMFRLGRRVSKGAEGEQIIEIWNGLREDKLMIRRVGHHP